MARPAAAGTAAGAGAGQTGRSRRMKMMGLAGSQLAKVRSSLRRHYEGQWGVEWVAHRDGFQSVWCSMCEWGVLNYIYTWRPCLQERPVNGCSGGRWLPDGHGVWQAWMLSGSYLALLHKDSGRKPLWGPHQSIWRWIPDLIRLILHGVRVFSWYFQPWAPNTHGNNWQWCVYAIKREGGV